MYGKVDLVVETPVGRGERFGAVVTVTSAKPGGDVTVILEQKRGAEPFMPRQSQVVVADEAGTARARFDATLAGPAFALLQARAYDVLGPHFEPDAEMVEVR